MNSVNFCDPSRVLTLSVDAYVRGVPEGRIYQGEGADCVPFYGLTQFLMEADRLLNDACGATAAQEPRSFVPEQLKKKYQAPITTADRQGKLDTFRISVRFRQNSSWQGTVYWGKTKEERFFRSVLELIYLMNGALEAAVSAGNGSNSAD